MRQLKFLVILVLLALLGGWTAIGQTVDCAEFKSFPAFFTTGEGNICGWFSIFTPIQFGKGWITTFSAENSWASAHRVQAGFVFNATPSQREAGIWDIATYYTYSDKWGNVSSGSAMGMTVWLDPGQVSTILLQAAKGCDIHGQNCEKAPDPEITVSGLVLFGFYAASPEVLRALKSPSLQMENLETGVILTITFQKPKPPALATIVATATTGGVQVSWTAVNAPNGVVSIYLNGKPLWNQLPKGTETDWGVPLGTHRYCIRAVNPDWTETDDLACSQIVVQ
ncbi:MAG: hypothetical protein WC884_01450 [Candidatus Paceibacterota bacterium]